jgi:hypothetical protein
MPPDWQISMIARASRVALSAAFAQSCRDLADASA